VVAVQDRGVAECTLHAGPDAISTAAGPSRPPPRSPTS
jgi:hypothetical protein